MSDLTAPALTRSDLPTAASTMPPGIGVSGSVGATASEFARADHTHASSVQRQKISFSTAAASIVWTYPKAYAAGVAPVAIATVENIAGAAQPYVVNLSGPAGNTSATFLVYKGQPTTLGGNLAALLGAVLSPFVNSAPTGLVLNCWVAPPTA